MNFVKLNIITVFTEARGNEDGRGEEKREKTILSVKLFQEKLFATKLHNLPNCFKPLNFSILKTSKFPRVLRPRNNPNFQVIENIFQLRVRQKHFKLRTRCFVLVLSGNGLPCLVLESREFLKNCTPALIKGLPPPRG